MTAGTTMSGRDTFSVFGTTATLLVTDAGALPAARRLADIELAAVDRACSRFRADSELSALNAAAGAALGISELFAELIDEALRAARLTDGAVDPTCGQSLAELGYDRDFALLPAAPARGTPPDPPPGSPGPGNPGPGSPGPEGTTRTAKEPAAGHAATDSAAAGQLTPVPGWRNVVLDRDQRRARLTGGAQLDLGATAKARAADRCAEVIAARLGCGVLVSLGGDIAVAGPGPAGGWRIRVTDDHAAGPDAPGQTVAITSGGLATSSTTVRAWARDGRRMHHIVDPATGQPARGCWRTVSVAAGSCVDANAASTAAIVLGAAAAEWLRDRSLPARLVHEDGSVETTAGWPQDPGPAPGPSASPAAPPSAPGPPAPPPASPPEAGPPAPPPRPPAPGT
jgi:thiamine biosynthesis lipoprotein